MQIKKDSITLQNYAFAYRGNSKNILVRGMVSLNETDEEDVLDIALLFASR